MLQAAGRNGLIRPLAVVLVLVPIAFAGIYGYRSAAREINETILSKHESIAYLIATVLNEKLDRLIDVGVSLATRVRFQELVEQRQWDRAIQIMHAVPLTFPHIERLFLADADGVLRADTPALPDVRGRRFADRDWYRGVIRTGAPYVSEIYHRYAAPPIDVVAVAIPVHGGAGQLAGILVLQVRLETFADWFKDAPVRPSWRIYIVDRNARAAFATEATPGVAVDVAHVAGVAPALAGKHGIELMRGPRDSEDQLTAYTAVPQYGWGVVITEPAAVAFASRNAQLRRFAVVFGVLLVLGLLVALLLLRAREQARRESDLQQLVAERTRALELANRELEAFSYSVSHDLRAPLRGIDGFSRILLEECRDRLDGRHADYLARIRAATQRMGELIDDLLQLSRVTRTELHRRRVDFTALAETVVRELQAVHPDREVSVTVQPHMLAVGDPTLLRVLLDNLLGNAWKFTGKTPAPAIEVGLQRGRDGRGVYFVRDNGAGFDPAYAHKLFGAFQRLHAVDEFPGIGIGLATVQRIVHRHGGRVWAEGAVGKGATFYFTLAETEPEPS